jgi:arylsulfatase A-like enzyme
MRTSLLLKRCSIALLLQACQPPEPPAKNVILITLDALRPDHLSFTGYSRETSPNIDWLARNGIVFPTIIPTGCSTKVSLTSLITSTAYSRHKLRRH